jgi:hypothetical protein
MFLLIRWKINHLNVTVYMNPLTLLVLYLVNADRICLQPRPILSSGLDGLLGKRLPLSSLSMFSLSGWRFPWFFVNTTNAWWYINKFLVTVAIGGQKMILNSKGTTMGTQTLVGSVCAMRIHMLLISLPFFHCKSVFLFLFIQAILG